MKKLLQQMKKLKSKLVEWVYSSIMPYVDRVMAKRFIKRLQKKKTDPSRPIRVGFVVQMPQIWNKEAPLYEAMVRNPRFEPWLIMVPSYNVATQRRGEYGEELEYFTTKYPEAKLLTTKELGEDFDTLPEQGFAYIFFQRCWETYLPTELWTRNVIRYAKTCYIPYDYHLGAPESGYYKMGFYTCLYVMFCSNDGDLAWYHPKRPRLSVSLGYPSLANLSYVNPPEQRLRILWTPRWVIEQTTFFAYKDRFLTLKQEHPEYEIVMRPHPLTFENAIRAGKMTEAEVAQYQASCQECGVRFDQNASIDDTLLQTDILVSDFSSVLADAASLGIPIIYTGKRDDVIPNEPMRRIVEAAYDADTWEKVKSCILDLTQERDPKITLRKSLSEEMTEANKNSVSSIMDYLYDDYM